MRDEKLIDLKMSLEALKNSLNFISLPIRYLPVLHVSFTEISVAPSRIL